jgi:8-oxoguanine deaminase
MLSEAHLAWYLHRAAKGAAGAPDGGADAASIEDVIRWGTAGGARVLGLHTGVLAPGYAADLAIYQPDELRHLGIHDAAVAPVASGVRAKLRRLICGGRTIVEDDCIPGLDLADLAAKVRATMAKMRLFTPPSYHLTH